MAEESVAARHERVNHFTGIGCLLQGLALLAPFAFGAAWGATGVLVGIPVAIALWTVGSRCAVTWRCGRCKNPLASADVRICPSCGATLH
jgi:hypothetical protein